MTGRGRRPIAARAAGTKPRRFAASESVAQFIAELPAPLRSEVELLRATLLASIDGVGEEIKWNAPSFHRGEHFATMRLTPGGALQLILHLGAKKSVIDRTSIADPEGVLTWLGPDRACIDFAAPGDVAARALAIRQLVCQWVQHIPNRPGG